MVKIIVGQNDLFSTNPELKDLWDYEKNIIQPIEVSAGSHKKAWWKCRLGHSFESQIKNIVYGKGCPYCAGRKTLVGYNDFGTWCINNDRIDLLNEYAPINSKKPSEYTYSSHEKVYWLCPSGHTYFMKISDRTVSGYGCPICSNHQLLSGYNDLRSWATKNNPVLIEEYSSKNEESMDIIMPNSVIKRLWHCRLCGNEYFSSPNSRVNMNSGCPKCAKRMYSSFPEQACYYYVLIAFSDAINGYKDIENDISELDIYVPSKKIGIEYDGKHWHKGNRSKEKQRQKYDACKKQSIKLIRIKEYDEVNDDCDINIVIPSDFDYYDALNITIKKLLSFLGIAVNVDVKRDELMIKEKYYQVLKSNSLQSQNPEIAREWDYKRNGSLMPSMVFKSSSDVVWWLCPQCGNEYKMRVNTRVSLPIGNCNKCRDHHYGEQFRRAVRQYTLDGEFIAEYVSITEAKKATGASSISICCNGKIQTSGGYKWKYADE